ncbi:MAG: DUF4430 domain-containing protein [Candidatus Aenigmarchaeota archaeon]|nr:DUF4430 domain-containing protein [Candidatus Aenigmarchaeota archaeon]
MVLASLAINLYLTFTSERYPEKIRVEARIDFGTSEKNKRVEVQNGTTVFEVLKSIATVEYKEYAGMGKFVTSIDGVAQNSTHSWMYYVNDEYAQVACDKYALTEDASFTFKYMSNEEAMGYVS